MKSCSICKKEVDAEIASILTMGGFGNPRYLCDECAAEIEGMLSERDSEKIEESMQKISGKLSVSDPDDSVVLDTVNDIFSKAGDRAKRIKEGTYDFSEDEEEDVEGFDEIPEELKETEEDRARDEQDSITAKKLDKISNWLMAAATVLALGFIILRFLR